MEPVSRLVFLSFTDLSDTGADAATQVIFVFLLLLGMVMYANEIIETKEK